MRQKHSFFYYLMTPFRWTGRLMSGLARPSPRGKVRWLVFGITLAFFLSAFLDDPRGWNRGADWLNGKTSQVKALSWVKIPQYWNVPYRLGLDLQGGTHLVYEADTKGIPESDRPEAIEGVRDVIERRVNAFGVAEPVVQTNKAAGKWRIIVELAGVRDVKEAIRMIGETPILEFKEENPIESVLLTKEQSAELDAKNAAKKKQAGDTLRKMLAEGTKLDFSAYARQFSEDSAVRRAVEMGRHASKNGLVARTGGNRRGLQHRPIARPQR